jgi:colicin import membrane protein
MAAQNLKEIESAMASEQTAQAGVSGSISDTLAAIIQQAVVGRWARPPSARNGMVAVLEIALVPTGDVVGVSVLTSSGDNAFDRSALNAVERAGRFPEVKQLERALFERDFRRFQLIFRPDDLRY